MDAATKKTVADSLRAAANQIEGEAAIVTAWGKGYMKPERLDFDAKPEDFIEALRAAPHHEVKRMFYGKPDTGTGGMDANYTEGGTTVAKKHIDYKRGKPVKTTYTVNLNYIEDEPVVGSFIGNPSKSIPYVKVEVREPPPDDLDAEFMAEVDVAFKLGGKLLAQLLGKQERVLPQALAEIKKKPALALKLLNKGGSAMRELKKSLDNTIRNAVADMADEEFERGASVIVWDFNENQNLSTVDVGNDGFILFSVDVGAMGKWD